MPLYDQEKMVRLVSELRMSVGRLRELAKLTQEDFLNDPDKVGSSKYHFIWSWKTTSSGRGQSPTALPVMLCYPGMMECLSVGMFDFGLRILQLPKEYFQGLRVLCIRFSFASKLHYSLKMWMMQGTPSPLLGG